jgi:hypothetical protein
MSCGVQRQVTARNNFPAFSKLFVFFPSITPQHRNTTTQQVNEASFISNYNANTKLQ